MGTKYVVESRVLRVHSRKSVCNVFGTNSTEEVEGMGEIERGDHGRMGEVVRSMLLDCVNGCCGKGVDALD